MTACEAQGDKCNVYDLNWYKSQAQNVLLKHGEVFLISTSFPKIQIQLECFAEMQLTEVFYTALFEKYFFFFK